jgi:2-polyprenyl-6-methoxyphenol hydroxylase-like FAD-dependent oxidoreductase
VLQAAGAQPYSTANTRELLMAHAPCECRRGVEVTGVLRDGGRVVGVRARDTAGGAEREVLAEWTVGDDGAHSVVRRCCGLPRTQAEPSRVMALAPDSRSSQGFGKVRCCPVSRTTRHEPMG